MAGLLSDVLPWVYSKSDQMKRNLNGLLSDPAGSAEQTLGLLSDSANRHNALMAVAFPDAKNPFKVGDQNALMEAANNMLRGPLSFAPVGMTAWHGSPHTFDKFDSSKIGTGEGAQAYGHGLYLAESPNVAKSYQETLSSTAPAKRAVSQSAGDVDSALQGAKSSVDGYRALIASGGGGDLRRAQGMLSLAEKRLEDLQRMKAGLPENTGALYKVDLPDEHVARMLDWDKPLSAQTPHVQNALQGFASPEKTGREIYEGWAAESLASRGAGADHNAYAANLAKQFGLPGIRYLDQGSRGVGAGSSNFVVFPGNEGLLNILERNSVPLR